MDLKYQKLLVTVLSVIGLLSIALGLFDMGLHSAPRATVAIVAGIAGWQVGDWVGIVAIWLANKLE